MDEVFKAIADPTRRSILDALRRTPGLSLTQLCELFPGMTRFGVSSHLGVLESAGLVSTVKQGRTKLHYLNPLPLREIQHRWLTDFTAASSDMLLSLRHHLETRMNPKPDLVHTVDIAVPIDVVWAELTVTGRPRPWLYDTIASPAWTVGGRHEMRTESGFLMIDGDVIEVDPPHRLVMGFHAHWDDDVDAEEPGTMTWELSERDGGTRLVVSLAGLGPATLASAQESTSEIYSALRDHLEGRTGTDA